MCCTWTRRAARVTRPVFIASSLRFDNYGASSWSSFAKFCKSGNFILKKSFLIFLIV